jgi:hypothetical protein
LIGHALTIGYDVRVSESIARAPFLTADLDMFRWASDGAFATAEIGTFVVHVDRGPLDPRRVGGAVMVW